MENNAVIGVVVAFGITFIGFLLNIYKQGKEQAEAQYRTTSELNKTISELRITIEKLNSNLTHTNLEVNRLDERLTVHGKEIDMIDKSQNTLSALYAQQDARISALENRVNTLESKRCVALQNINNVSEN